MAIMIPETPKEFVRASLEDVMFESLRLLPNDYYVFHSFKISTIKDNRLCENETDFVIFCKNKGVLCVEAKAGHVFCKNRTWFYGNNVPMHNGGPFFQAEQNKWKLINFIRENQKLEDILNKCKFHYGVWFPSVREKDMKDEHLGGANKELVLFEEDLENPLPTIERIFDIEIKDGLKTNLNEQDTNRLLNEVFCPSFNIFPTCNLETDIKKIIFHRMLEEQINVLNFLEEQKTVAISGVAGTGKTLIAVEKAQRLAASGKKVLFICFNSMLQEYLCRKFKSNGIDFFTLAYYACKECDTAEPDYEKLNQKLENYFYTNAFPYDNVIIDEGQDLGQDKIEKSKILETLKEIMNETEQGSLFIFYDKLQLVQSNVIPNVIQDSDCKITLYRNCRNTQNIAKTSMRAFTSKNPKMKDNYITGLPANMHFIRETNDYIKVLDNVIDKLNKPEFESIVILTCTTEEKSVLARFIKNGFYKNIKFTTCRKFKGLESDAVILVDIVPDCFKGENTMIYYEGTSRAKYELELLSEMTEEDCKTVLIESLHKEQKRIRSPKSDLAKALNARYFED